MSDRKTEPRLIFIVGLPRTGTKLVKVILHKSQDPCCRISAETWFFGDLFRSGVRRKIASIGNMQDDGNVDRLVEFFFSGTFKRSYWLLAAKADSGFDKEALRTRILESDRSDRSIFLAIMEAFAARDPRWLSAGNQVIGDKTPGHVYYVPELLEWFPEAKIVHTFRDPRAIVASELRKIVGERNRKTGFSLVRAWKSLLVTLYITVTWLYARRLHRRYTERYPRNYMLSKYEDLVSNPSEHIGPLCEFLDLEPNDEMLAPRRADSSFASASGEAGFATENLDRWRVTLSPAVQWWFRLWTGRHLAEFGYKP